ncbi:hypothetical protein BU17DRAFT_56244, partial [Hysterangium stoloniferum]
KYKLIPEIASHLSHATAAFHAYAHQICCQIVFNPQWSLGFGITNDKGNEQIWSFSKDIIGCKRISSISGIT